MQICNNFYTQHMHNKLNSNFLLFYFLILAAEFVSSLLQIAVKKEIHYKSEKDERILILSHMH